jgi:DNA mismatch repair ATPase MutS
MSTLALTVTRNMLGAAYLENDHVKILSSISYSEQNIESCNHDSLVLLQSQPVTVIVTSRADDSLLKLLENQEWVLEQRPSSDFRTSIGKQELLNLQLSDSFSLETFINANSSSIGCAGCIITYQSRSQIVKINQVSMVHLDSVMFIPKDTYWALSIFEKVQHPNIQSTSVVEGMSLYGILNKTKSKGGSKVLLKWFYNPLQRLSEIEYRQSMVELFALTENQESRTELQSQMKHVSIVNVSFVD